MDLRFPGQEQDVLTYIQLTAFQRLSSQFQERLRKKFLVSPRFEDHRFLQKILNIVNTVQFPDLEETVEKFFMTLTENPPSNLIQLLDTILLFSQAGHGSAFFIFARTKKREFHPEQILGDIISSFKRCVDHFDPYFLSNLPPYDEGGKEYVEAGGETKKSAPLISLKSRLQALLDENSSFLKIRALATQYLAALPSEQRLSLNLYSRFFTRLNSDASLPFKEYEKRGLLKLIVLTTSHSEKPLFEQYFEEDLWELMDSALELHNQCGEELLHKFCTAPSLREGGSLYDVVRAMQLLSGFGKEPIIHDELARFERGCSLVELLEGLENEIAAAPFNSTTSEIVLDSFLHRFAGHDPDVAFPLAQTELQMIRRQFLIVQQRCQEWHSLTLRPLAKKAWEIRARFVSGQAGEEELLSLLSIGSLGLRLKFNRYPYPTQILTILGLLLKSEGRIAQKKTGEGKSMVVALLDFVLAMQGRAVDSQAPSPDLAIRQDGHFKTFFKSFGITTSHICAKPRLPEHFRGQILYGTGTDFQFAVMEEKLWFKSFFAERLRFTKVARNFDCIVIDEADNLTIDTLLNSARLSAPAEDSYDWVYTPLIQFTKSHLFSKKFDTPFMHLALPTFRQISAFFQQIPDAALAQLLFEVYTLEENRDFLIPEEREEQEMERQARIPDGAKLAAIALQNEGLRKVIYNYLIRFVKRIISEENSELAQALLTNLRSFLSTYMDGRFSKDAGKISNKQLLRWLQSAIRALFDMSENRDYILTEEKDRQGKVVKKVIIVDYDNTGQLMFGSRWSHGLHEMVEAKHGIEIERESLCPISMSNVTFYNLYRRKDGLTGTAGTLADRQEILRFYHLDSFDVPPYRPSLRIDLPTVIFPTDEELFKGVRDRAKAMQQAGRPYLVLCESIHDSEKVAEILTIAQIRFQLFNEKQKADKIALLERAGHPGIITIATLNAARGTDIILTEQSLANGGLFVTPIFFPKSKRVQDQALGRAGRQGQPGSSEILLSLERLRTDNLDILRQNREARNDELRAVRATHADVECFTAELMESFFSLYRQFQMLINSETFLNSNSEHFSKRQIRDPTLLPSIAHLAPKDRYLMEDMIHLLTNGQENSLSWKTLFNQIGKRIMNKMIQHWSIFFRRRVEELLSEQHDASSDELNKLIQELFNSQQDVWRSYLDPSGVGIAKFIEELTGLNFSPFMYLKQL